MAGPTPTFEPGPVNPASFNFDYHVTPPNDPLAFIDGEPRRKLVALTQRSDDLFAQVPPIETVQEVRLEKIRLEKRIADLVRPRGHEGGYGLDPEGRQVLIEEKKLERLETELARLTKLKDERSARCAPCKQLARTVSDWLVRGIPSGCMLAVVEDAPPSALLTKADAGRLDAAAMRYRQQVETHAAALKKLEVAPYTAKEARAAIASEINARADASVPNVVRVTRFLEPIRFATTFSQGLAQNLDPKVPPAIIGNETTDTLGLFCWMFRDQLITKLQGMVTESDGAVSQQDREVEAARIGGLLLEVERKECACIWHAEARGEIIDWRANTSPQALLGVRLITAPPAPTGTSPEHVIEVRGARHIFADTI